ncbi:hypothetical protein Taro_011676 [Colocasia esculenta]|uniref:Uncharacterized protein n=1 Tax=Colocasia esculenta TaxID=4460 RepID=A0A843UAT2_COLES|nr:hypothetical protein [Colocasia esculenta]
MLRLCQHKSRVCRHELQFFRNQSTQVDTLSEQVDTRPSSQNNQFEELGQQVDTLSELVDTEPSSQNISSHIWDSVSTLPPGQVDTLREALYWPSIHVRDPTASQRLLKVPWRLQEKPLKHPKEADPVEAFVGEEFKEDPTIPKCKASVLDF